MTKEQRTKLLKPITIQDVKTESFFCIYEDLYFDEKNQWEDLSQEAKIVYFAMYSRLRASILNDWVDKDGKIFIYFSQEDVMKYQRCGKDKAISIKKQLLEVGLIENVKQGQGKPDRIYLKSWKI